MPYVQPLVTIGVAVYNGANHIIETLESINAQTYDNIQLIIVDDGSTDNSYDLCSEWIADSHFSASVIKNCSNLGLTKTCNVILNTASGKYLQLFGQDDIMLPGKIENDVELFEQQPEKVALMYSKLKLINEKSELIDQDYLERIKFKGLESKDIFIELTKMNFIPAPSVIVRTELIKKEGGFDENLLFEDWDMWLRLAKKYEFLFNDAANVHYRIHSNSMMANRNGEQTIIRNRANIKMFQKHLGNNKIHDEALYKKLKELSIYSYFLGDKDAGKILYDYLRKKFDSKIWIYHKLALLGIKHSSFSGFSKLKSNDIKAANV